MKWIESIRNWMSTWIKNRHLFASLIQYCSDPHTNFSIKWFRFWFLPRLSFYRTVVIAYQWCPHFSPDHLCGFNPLIAAGMNSGFCSLCGAILSNFHTLWYGMAFLFLNTILRSAMNQTIPPLTLLSDQFILLHYKCYLLIVQLMKLFVR